MFNREVKDTKCLNRGIIIAVLMTAWMFPSWAQDSCAMVVGEGSSMLDPEMGFIGSADVLVNGQPVTIHAWAILMGTLKVDEDGTEHAVTSHQFTFPDGSTITTFDDATLAPTDNPGVVSLTTRARIEAGSGRYWQPAGEFVFTGEIDFTTGQATWSMMGKICAARKPIYLEAQEVTE